MAVEFSFLTAGPTWRCSLPEGYEAQPREWTAPFQIAPGAVREFVLDRRGETYAFFDSDRFRVTDEYTTASGVPVRVYERLSPPRVWFLKWTLGDRVLVTHVRDEDGYERALQVAKTIDIVDAAGGQPLVVGDADIRPVPSLIPKHQEAVLFGRLRSVRRPSRGFAEHVTFVRPALLKSGATRLLEDRFDEARSVPRSHVHLGGPMGVEVRVAGAMTAKDATQLAATILKSLES